MKERKIVSGIYQIRNIKTGKLYIGSSIDVYKRFDQHKNSLQKGKHHSTKLQRSYNATKDKSVFVFEIVELVSDIIILKDREQFYINEYDSFNTGYNCSALVDNPKYSEKNLKKTNKKKELDSLYDEFWSLFDETTIDIRRKLFGRIELKHYSNVTMKKLICALKWFYDNYDKNTYTMRIRYSGRDCWLIICDKNRNNFALYSFGKDVLYSQIGSEIYLNDLKDKGLYNPSIHDRIVN